MLWSSLRITFNRTKLSSSTLRRYEKFACWSIHLSACKTLLGRSLYASLSSGRNIISWCRVFSSSTFFMSSRDNSFIPITNLGTTDEWRVSRLESHVFRIASRLSLPLGAVKIIINRNVSNSTGIDCSFVLMAFWGSESFFTSQPTFWLSMNMNINATNRRSSRKVSFLRKSCLFMKVEMSAIVEPTVHELLIWLGG